MQPRSFLQSILVGISLFTLIFFQQFCDAQTTEALKITVFPGAQNLPLWVAQEKGFFRDQGLDIEVTLTMNSDDLRNGLINGKFQIAHSAVDNSVAIVVQTGSPSVILMGGDSSMNELFVQPNIKTMQDMRGKKLLVDAPNTAYALQAIRALSLAGVKDTEFSLKIVGRTGLRLDEMVKNPQDSGASTLNPPFSFEAKNLKRLQIG
jgi:ABC-type nitrate/sulfonate/bicarbonate transport system substrate-binding protein